jgi:hypothetical protein
MQTILLSTGAEPNLPDRLPLDVLYIRTCIKQKFTEAMDRVDPRQDFLVPKWVYAFQTQDPFALYWEIRRTMSAMNSANVYMKRYNTYTKFEMTHPHDYQVAFRIMTRGCEIPKEAVIAMREKLVSKDDHYGEKYNVEGYDFHESECCLAALRWVE